MKIKPLLAIITFAMTLAIATAAFGQITFPRISQWQSIEQTIGDIQVRIVYNRPTVKGRTAFGAEGAVVPYGKVWRAGANEATLFEFSNDVKVNGKELLKGKYGFYFIPNERS